jgi:hypothetical protein
MRVARRFAASCCYCPAGSPTARAAGRCTCLPAGRGSKAYRGAHAHPGAPHAHLRPTPGQYIRPHGGAHPRRDNARPADHRNPSAPVARRPCTSQPTDGAPLTANQPRAAHPPDADRWIEA